jgi:hypothetical protein
VRISRDAGLPQKQIELESDGTELSGKHAGPRKIAFFYGATFMDILV